MRDGWWAAIAGVLLIVVIPLVMYTGGRIDQRRIDRERPMQDLPFHIEHLTTSAHGSTVPFIVDSAGRRKRTEPEVGQLWDAYQAALARVAELEAAQEAAQKGGKRR